MDTSPLPEKNEGHEPDGRKHGGQKSFSQKVKSAAKWTGLSILVAIAFLASGGWMLVVWLVMHLATDGWKPLAVDENSTRTVHSIPFRKNTVEVVLSGYEIKQDIGPVDLQVSFYPKDAKDSMATHFPSLPSFYNSEWRAMGEQEAAYYKLEDVDGDWKRDFLIKVDASLPSYYYISSRGGRGFQSDERFKAAQPWLAEPQADSQF